MYCRRGPVDQVKPRISRSAPLFDKNWIEVVVFWSYYLVIFFVMPSFYRLCDGLPKNLKRHQQTLASRITLT